MKVPQGKSGPFCRRFAWFTFAKEKGSDVWIGGSVLTLTMLCELFIGLCTAENVLLL